MVSEPAGRSRLSGAGHRARRYVGSYAFDNANRRSTYADADAGTSFSFDYDGEGLRAAVTRTGPVPDGTTSSTDHMMWDTSGSLPLLMQDASYDWCDLDVLVAGDLAGVIPGYHPGPWALLSMR